jgi:hypothetical protein
VVGRKEDSIVTLDEIVKWARTQKLPTSLAKMRENLLFHLGERVRSEGEARTYFGLLDDALRQLVQGGEIRISFGSLPILTMIEEVS